MAKRMDAQAIRPLIDDLEKESQERLQKAIELKGKAEIVQGQLKAVDLLKWPSRKAKDQEIRRLRDELQRHVNENGKAASRVNELNGTIAYLRNKLTEAGRNGKKSEPEAT